MKQRILDCINTGMALLIGTVRTPNNKFQIDRWKLDDTIYLITSIKLRHDVELQSPFYGDDVVRLELLTEIN